MKQYQLSLIEIDQLITKAFVTVYNVVIAASRTSSEKHFIRAIYCVTCTQKHFPRGYHLFLKDLLHTIIGCVIIFLENVTVSAV